MKQKQFLKLHKSMTDFALPPKGTKLSKRKFSKNWLEGIDLSNLQMYAGSSSCCAAGYDCLKTSSQVHNNDCRSSTDHGIILSSDCYGWAGIYVADNSSYGPCMDGNCGCPGICSGSAPMIELDVYFGAARINVSHGSPSFIGPTFGSTTYWDNPASPDDYAIGLVKLCFATNGAGDIQGCVVGSTSATSSFSSASLSWTLDSSGVSLYCHAVCNKDLSTNMTADAGMGSSVGTPAYCRISRCCR